MKVKRLSRVRIAIIRETPYYIDNIKSESIASCQQGNTPRILPCKNEFEEKISLNVKPEDTKDTTLNNRRTSNRLKLLNNTTAQSTKGLGDIYFKQEDDVKYDTSVMEAKKSRDKEYDYECRKCGTKFVDYPSVMRHRKSVHNVKGFTTIIKHVYLTPDNNDPNNYCKSCEKTFPTRATYKQHLTHTHYLAWTKSWVAPSKTNHAIIPDPDDPNFHCRSCNSTYAQRYAYRNHLKRIHNMQVPPKSRSSIKNNSVLPDWNDPSKYCPSCDRQYQTRKNFIDHCTKTHDMRSPNIQRCKEEDLPVLRDPNFHCKVCNIGHKNEYRYRMHCYKVHRMRMIITDPAARASNTANQCKICNKTFCNKTIWNKHLFITHRMDSDAALPPSTKPDINNPDYCCTVCGRSLGSERYLKYHSIAIHSIQDDNKNQASKKSKPDIDDPNNYCRVCKRTFASTPTYRRHVIYIHQVPITKPVAYHPSRFPDPLDPNWYCSVCESYFKSQPKYRHHCKEVHRMTIVPLAKIRANPNAKIDINDPNYYCAQCDKTLKARENFIAHLKQVHKLARPPKPMANPGATIDPNDPNRYCAKCERQYRSNTNFKIHLERIHNLVLVKKAIK
ncbi:hypothetical protein MBANPS3_000579 [Mucor bainieri]